MRESSVNSISLGQILLKKGQVRRYQIDFLLELQEAYIKKGIHRKIGELMLRHRAVTPSSLDEALKFQTEVGKEEKTDRITDLLTKEQEGESTKLLPTDS